MRQTTRLTRLFRNWEWAVLRLGVASVWIGCLLSVCAPSSASQAQGIVVTQSTTASKNKKPLDLVLRSIAVLEWTGPLDKPKSSILIPVAVYTDGQYMDGGAYLAQPVPLAVQQGTQYVLEKSGMPQGEYNVEAASQMQGAWFGSGTWESIKTAKVTARSVGDRDRPHFFDSKNQTAGNKTANTTAPTLHLRPPPPDPDRPVMKYGESGANNSPATQPDVSPLKGEPRQQMIAISDASQTVTRPLTYRWSSEAAKATMQKKIGVLAEKYFRASSKPKKNSDSSLNSASAASAAIPLDNIHFQCFALTLEKKASEETPTCVFSAETPGENGVAQFATLIARPDIYGALQAISYGVTDSSQLATHPRVRLVDAVNATASGNAELLFELDGPKEQKFALYAFQEGHLTLVYVTQSLPF